MTKPASAGKAGRKKSQQQARQKRSKVSEARQQSLKALKQVFAGQSLSSVQPNTIDKLADSRDRGLANEIVNGVLRWRWQLESFISSLLAKPLKQKDSDVQLVLLMALYELQECRTPDYAIINEAVELVRKSGKKWAASLVNAVLRRFTRERELLAEGIKNDSEKFSHPEWIVNRIKEDWPQYHEQILQANNQRPAFWLRVNQRQYELEHYRSMLTEAGIAFDQDATDAISLDQAIKLLQGIDVRTLPGFEGGAVSVQDAGAQLSATLLDICEQDESSVLDLCAAPGGKTCHILERHPAINKLVAVELDEGRMKRVAENLQRLKLLPENGSGTDVELVTADAREYKQWWSGEPFGRILIDAPCSASGVIRRHPDIKTLRRESDIQALVELQAEILDAAWQMLAVGGELLYVTCSIFKDENERQMGRFISTRDDADEIIITQDMIGEGWGVSAEYGRQLFPGEYDADGFYYCRIKKTG